MATQISKKKNFVSDGVFYAELNEMLTRELAEDGYSGVEVRVTPMRTEIIIRATRTQNVLGEKGRRIRELTSVVQKRFNFPENGVKLYAEKVVNRGLCAIGGLAVRSSKEAMESVSGTEYRECKAVMSNKEEEKECQITKEEKGKKHKDKGRGSNCEGKAVMSNKEEEKECQVTKEDKGQKKGKKHKDKGRGSDCEGKAVMSNKLEEKECQITKEEKGHKVKKHKDKGRGSDCEGKAVMSNKEEKDCQMTKEEKGRKKGKKHKDKGRGSDCDSSIHSGDRNHSIEMEQADVSAKMAENPCLEHAEGVMSKSSLKKHRQKKKKDKEVETIGQTRVLDTDENVGSEDAERNNREREHDRKSKKRKRKHQDDETASNGSGNTIVLGEDKRRKKECLVTLNLEEGNKSDMSKIGKKTEIKKKRKERNNIGVDLRQNTQAAEGKNGKGNKEIKVCEDENDRGEREKENMAKRKDKGRRVSFTEDVEVFNIGGSDDVEGDGSGETELVHGRWFTSEEDAKLMEAMVKYAEMKQLGEKGLEMIGDCSKHPEIKGCWAEIAKSLPHRPAKAIYKRARILLQRSAERKWTDEEYEIVRRFVEKNGTNWRVLAKELGKNEIHVKDTWRRMKPKNLKKGAWTQDEYQNLFDLVNLDLRVKAHQNFDPGHRQLKDNISWEAISEKLTTRSNHTCCSKWYQQLTSPLVKEGIWADIDDYLLVEALQNVDAVCVEDVDWENLLEHRSGELCRQRWNQMVRLIGGHRDKPFIEQVEVLARRYCPEMLAYRKPEAGELAADELAGGSDL